MPAPIPFSAEALLGVTPAQLYPVISNTNRLNRSLGLPQVQVEGGAHPEDFSLRVRSKLMGLSLSWKEMPFEWVEGRYFTLVRLFDGGPISRFEAKMSFAPEGKDCRFRMEASFLPRSAFGAFLIRHVAGPKALADFLGMAKTMAAELVAQEQDPLLTRRNKGPIDVRALSLGASALAKAPVDQALAQRLLALLAEGYDEQVVRMRPFELADAWGAPRLEALRVFFYAVKAGLLDMGWEVLCPNCSVPDRVASLGELRQAAHCPTCKLDFSVGFEESVEVRFSVNAAVRQASAALFCAGSPAHTPFALAQVRVEAAKPRELALSLGEESYLVRSLLSRRQVMLRPSASAPAEVALDWDAKEAAFRPGEVVLRLPGEGSAGLVRVEKEAWRDRGAKASLVTTLQEFRGLFSSEVLSPGVEIGVKNIAMMFTDLKGSTALYESVGDAAAYAMVRKHFDYLFEIVARHDGAVVKTIGDAVMAVFSKGSLAMEAALEAQERICDLNGKLAPNPDIVIKLGIHQGPAIAINSNEVLDYFGTTINVAARVQNESAGADIVLTESMTRDLAVQDILKQRGIMGEEFELKLKGLTESFKLTRLHPKAEAR